MEIPVFCLHRKVAICNPWVANSHFSMQECQAALHRKLQTDSNCWLKLFALQNLYDTYSWVIHDCSLDTTPHLAHRSKKAFRLVHAVEFEVDNGVVWIVNRS